MMDQNIFDVLKGIQQEESPESTFDSLGKEILETEPFYLAQHSQGGVLSYTLTYMTRSMETIGMVVTSEQEWFPCTFKDLTGRGFAVPDCLQVIENGFIRIQLPTAINRWTFPEVQAYVEGKTSEVNPFELFTTLKTSLEQFVHFLDHRYATFFALHILLTYCFTLFHSLPIINIMGPKASGKTTLLHLLESVCFNPLMTSSLTPSAMARAISVNRATVLQDEAENLSTYRSSNELFQLLRASYIKAGARTISGWQQPLRQYSVYAPCVLVNVRGLDDALRDRTLTFLSVRKDRHLPAFVPYRERERCQGFISQLYLCALQNAQRIHEAYLSMEQIADLTNRELDLWKGIIAIAKVIDENNSGDSKVEELTSLALDMRAQKQSEMEFQDVELQVLWGTYHFLKDINLLEKNIATVMASELAEYVSKAEELRRFRTEDLGRILNRYQLIKERLRTRPNTGSSDADHPKVHYVLNVKGVKELLNQTHASKPEAAE